MTASTGILYLGWSRVKGVCPRKGVFLQLHPKSLALTLDELFINILLESSSLIMCYLSMHEPGTGVSWYGRALIPYCGQFSPMEK